MTCYLAGSYPLSLPTRLYAGASSLHWPSSRLMVHYQGSKLGKNVHYPSPRVLQEMPPSGPFPARPPKGMRARIANETVTSSGSLL